MSEDNTTIGITKENWKRLRRLEDDKDLKTHDEAIDYLFDNQKKK